jgi:amidase
MTDWHHLPAIDLAAAIKNKRISAVTLLECYEERINRLNPGLNAIVATDFANAKSKADIADRAIANGNRFGPLHGVPISIKDNLEVAGMPCTAGATDFKNNQPSRNADLVDSLIKAGAIVFGKSNLPRFAEDFQTYNELFGQTNNPWDLSKTPGGSSGGAAVAVAAGLTAFEIGNDIGGSIRIPAHFCGVYGHKPSYGIVPDRGTVPPPPGIFTGDYSLNMDIVVNGPLARSPEDLGIILDLIVQPEAPERKAWKIELPPAKKTKLTDFKVGIWIDHPACPVDQEIVSRIREVGDKLANEGVNVEEQHPEIDFGRSFEMFTSLLNGALGQAAPTKVFRSWVAKEAELDHAPDSYRTKQIRGAVQRHRNWLMRDVERQLIRQKWQEYFDRFDVMLCPAVATTAIPHDHSSWFDRTITINGKAYPYSNLMGWAGLTNVAYLPSTTAPVGLAANGLPIGLQIVGPYLEDKTCIQFAVLLKQVIGGFTPPPDFL